LLILSFVLDISGCGAGKVDQFVCTTYSHSPHYIAGFTYLKKGELHDNESQIGLGGCRPSPPIPKEGDLVTWIHSSQLVIKTKLGQRREHIVTNEDYDYKLYEPAFETFVGQFPIDYVPQSFPRMTQQEYIAFKNKKEHSRFTL